MVLFKLYVKIKILILDMSECEFFCKYNLY